MCGIVGIYLKSEKFESSLGKMLSDMLVNMGSRGPDSAGFAIYKKEDDGSLTLKGRKKVSKKTKNGNHAWISINERENLQERYQ